MKHVDQESLNVRSIHILIRHNHNATIAKFTQVRISAAVFKSQDLFDCGQLLVVVFLVDGRIAHIERLALEGKYAIPIAPNN